LTLRQNVVFIVFLIVTLIRKIVPIDIKYFDFIIVGVFFLSTLSFKMSFCKKIIMVFLFSVFCTVRIRFKIQGIAVNLRAEDFVAVIMAVYLLCSWLKKEFKLKKIDIIILGYILYNAIVLCVNCVLKNNEPMYFMIWLKEVQYFVYFVFFTNTIKRKEDVSFIMIILLYCSINNIVWGGYQVINGTVSYYGIESMSSRAAAHSGGIYFIITVIMMYLFSKKENLFFLLVAIISSILTCFVVSRIFILSLIFMLGVYFLYDFSLIIFARKNKKMLLFYGCLLLVGIILLLNFENFVGNTYIRRIIARFSRFDAGSSVRINKWGNYLDTSNILGIVFGNGKGFSQSLRNGTFRLHTDSQYVCSILESGIIGTLIFLWILFEVSLKHFFKKQFNHETVFLCIITASYLLVGVTIEVFQTVLQASLFWCVVGTWYKYNELNNPPEVLLLEEKQNE